MEDVTYAQVHAARIAMRHSQRTADRKRKYDAIRGECQDFGTESLKKEFERLKAIYEQETGKTFS